MELSDAATRMGGGGARGGGRDRNNQGSLYLAMMGLIMVSLFRSLSLSDPPPSLSLWRVHAPVQTAWSEAPGEGGGSGDGAAGQDETRPDSTGRNC